VRGRQPESPAPIGGVRPPTERVIRSLDDVHGAVDWFVDHIPANEIVSNATHFSTDVDFKCVDDAEMSAALARRNEAGPAERDVYASYINEAFLTAFDKRFGGTLLFQFSTAAEPLPFETSSRISQRMLGQLAEIIGRHPRVRFQCHVSSAHANQTLCTLCRELPNLSLAGYWWHNFFPSIMLRIMEERLDMLPVNRQVGFLSRRVLHRMDLRQERNGQAALGGSTGEQSGAGHVPTRTPPWNIAREIPLCNAADVVRYEARSVNRQMFVLHHVRIRKEISRGFTPPWS